MSDRTDLALLETDCIDCRACNLGTNRRQIVWSSGGELGKLALVGEAPGAEEDMCGLPFMGRAGKLLDRILAAPLVGIPRRHVYICNTVKCKPPQNRTPTKSEITTCSDKYLHRQLQYVKPKLIIAMGNPAMGALLGRFSGIMTCHGEEFTYRDTPVITTYHTAFLLRYPQHKRDAYEDWQFISQRWEELENGS